MDGAMDGGTDGAQVTTTNLLESFIWDWEWAAQQDEREHKSPDLFSALVLVGSKVSLEMFFKFFQMHILWLPYFPCLHKGDIIRG